MLWFVVLCLVQCFTVISDEVQCDYCSSLADVVESFENAL